MKVRIRYQAQLWPFDDLAVSERLVWMALFWLAFVAGFFCPGATHG